VAWWIWVLGGLEAEPLRVAEAYLAPFGRRANTGNSLIVPSYLADVGRSSPPP
jgi:hypothetical protein